MDGSVFPKAEVSRDVPANMADRLIVALDVPTPEQASNLIDRLDGIVSFYKIGMGLFVARGTEALIDKLIDSGKSVFLDYKMFDIPQTVRQGVERAKERGVRFVTVHGDEEIMRAAVEGRGNSDYLKIFSITVLTSLDNADLKKMGYEITVPQLIKLRVEKSLSCGCDGIIASANDKPNEIRRLFANDGLLIATPGIRSAGTATHDQKRIATPEQAIADGADYLVMGRQIIESPDPKVEALAVIEEMKRGAAAN